ncbi:nucleotidyltransferase domain-containing protein [Acidobacteriota bacterium]
MNKSVNEKDLVSYFEKIAEDMQISMAYLYGSFLDDTFNKFSDIDIALVIKDLPDKQQLMQLEMKLTALLDKRFKTPFDVRTINDAPLKVKGEVVTHGKLIYCADEEFRVNFETYIRDRYFDFLPTLNFMREVYLSSVKSGGLIGQT